MAAVMSESRQKIEAIAAAQKLLLWAILAGIAGTLGGMSVRASLSADPTTSPGTLIALGGLQIAIVILQLVAVIKLCLALDEGWVTAIYAVLQCVPCVNLILLLLLNGRATRRLQAAKIRVGLMGANSSDVANYQPRKRACSACGEPLVSGATTCPMCGAAL